MKCLFCYAEWTPPVNESLSKCPFCQTDILQVLNLKITELTPEVILRNMLQVYGMELLQQEQRLSAMITDLFAHDKRTKKMLLLSVKEKVPQQLLTLTDNDERETRLNEILFNLKKEAFLNEETSNQIVSFWRFLPKNWEVQGESFEIAWHRGYCGFRNSKGKMITSYYYDDAKMFQEGLAAVKKNGKWGFIDMRGNEIITLKYRDVHSFSEGLAGVQPDNYWGFINKLGETIIPHEYGDVKMFKEGLSAVRNYWDSKYGYIDHQGNIVIDMIYDVAHSFNEGVAYVEGNNGYYRGYFSIDSKGKKIRDFYSNPIFFDSNHWHDDGFHKIEENGKYGLKDLENNAITPIKYDRIEPFSNGFAVVQFNNENGFIDKKGAERIVPYFLQNFSEGIARGSYSRFDGPYTYFNTEGEIITPKLFHTADDFNGGEAMVSFRLRVGFDRVDYKEKSGHINKFGFWVYSKSLLPECVGYNFLFSYDYVRSFSDGLIAVSFNYKWGYVNTKGKVVIQLKYNMAFSFINKFAIVQNSINDKYGVIDVNEEIIVPFLYDSIRPFERGLAVVELDNCYGCVDKSGYPVIPLIFQYIYFPQIFEGLICVKLDEKWGFIDFLGNEVISCKYTRLGYCTDGLLLVNIGGQYIRTESGTVFWGGKYGAIDKHGNEIIPIEYDILGYMKVYSFFNGIPQFSVDDDERYYDDDFWTCKFYNGITRFYKNGKWGVIDINKDEIEIANFCGKDEDYTRIIYDDKYGDEHYVRTVYYDFIGKCFEDRIRVRNGSKFGFIDKDGIELIECKYDRAFDFYKGLAKVNIGGSLDYNDCGVREFSGGLWGYVNLMGVEQIPIIYDEIEEGSYGSFNVVLKGKRSIIDKYGK